MLGKKDQLLVECNADSTEMTGWEEVRWQRKNSQTCAKSNTRSGLHTGSEAQSKDGVGEREAGDVVGERNMILASERLFTTSTPTFSEWDPPCSPATDLQGRPNSGTSQHNACKAQGLFHSTRTTRLLPFSFIVGLFLFPFPFA